MLLLRKPSREFLQEFICRQADAPLSYVPFELTVGSTPPGYVVDYERTELGSGPDTFNAACDALRSWKMFDLGWVCVVDSGCPLAVGQVVGVLAHVGRFWTLNACRIVQVFDEPGRRLGFVYGTLGEHVEEGAERFVVERDSANRVWFDLLAVSRPHLWYVRLARPLARLFQRRFRRCSALAMLRATQPSGD
jgi:uncharacterized protein (UPF0548 family)